MAHHRHDDAADGYAEMQRIENPFYGEDYTGEEGAAIAEFADRNGGPQAAAERVDAEWGALGAGAVIDPEEYED